jgi:hypothetical protein
MNHIYKITFEYINAPIGDIDPTSTIYEVREKDAMRHFEMAVDKYVKDSCKQEALEHIEDSLNDWADTERYNGETELIMGKYMWNDYKNEKHMFMDIPTMITIYNTGEEL